MIFKLLDLAAAFGLRHAACQFFPNQVSELMFSIACLDAQPNDLLNDSDFDILIRALVAAEDRRFFSHRGVDSKGLVRAVLTFFTKKKIQGASTITQQMVRVLTNDYRYSVWRKFKEMCLACAVDREISKITQATLYIRIAYFGWQMNDVKQAWRQLNLSSPLSQLSAALLIARLRYPEPREATLTYIEKLNRRARYVAAAMNR